MGVHAGVWLRVGVGLSLGLVALSLWDLGVYFRSRLVLGARKYNGIRGNRKQLAADNASCEGTAWANAGIHSWGTCASELCQRDQSFQPRRNDRADDGCDGSWKLGRWDAQFDACQSEYFPASVRHWRHVFRSRSRVFGSELRSDKLW